MLRGTLVLACTLGVVGLIPWEAEWEPSTIQGAPVQVQVDVRCVGSRVGSESRRNHQRGRDRTEDRTLAIRRPTAIRRNQAGSSTARRNATQPGWRAAVSIQHPVGVHAGG
jgi:hypothetical protein